MANLTSTIEALAQEFARGVMSALRGASLTDIVELTSGSSPRKAGRPPAKGKKGTLRPGWPKCKTCGKNAHPRGKGYCWEHALAAGVVKGNGRTTKASTKPAKGKRKRGRPKGSKNKTASASA